MMTEKNIIKSCVGCPVQWKGFVHLTAEEMGNINKNRYEANFRPGEIIVKQGSPSSNVLFISSGLAKTYFEGTNSKNFILNINLPGNLILGPGAFIDSRNSFTVSAITAVRTCFIGFEVFRQLIKTNGAFAESLIEDLSVRSQWTNNRMVSLTQKKMSGRLAEALIYLADDIFGSDEFGMILSRQELGDMTNMAKECVVRILKEMEDSGAISSGSSGIRILDKERLRLISEKG